MTDGTNEHAPAGAEEQPSGISDAISAGLQRFGEGHPAESAEWDEGNADETPEETPGGEPGAGTSEDDGTPPSGGGADEPGGGQDETPEDRIKTLEEEKARLSQDLDRYRQDEQARKKEKARQGFQDQVRTFSLEKNTEALKKIDALDPDDFENDEAYNAKVAEIWADKDAQVAGFLQTGGQQAGEGNTPPAEDDSREAPGDTRGEPGAGSGGEHEEPRTTWADVTAMVQEKDPNFNTKDVAFLGYCRQAPKAMEGKALSLEQQVDWAIKQTKSYHKSLVRGAAADRADQHQRRNQPLGRGANPTPAGGGKEIPPAPVTLNDAVNRAQESRRL